MNLSDLLSKGLVEKFQSDPAQIKKEMRVELKLYQNNIWVLQNSRYFVQYEKVFTSFTLLQRMCAYLIIYVIKI